MIQFVKRLEELGNQALVSFIKVKKLHLGMKCKMSIACPAELALGIVRFPALREEPHSDVGNVSFVVL